MSHNSSNREDSAGVVDISSNAFDDVERVATEQSPLLPNDAPPQKQIVPSKAFQRKVMGMCILMLFVVEVSQFIMEPPLQKIMEDIICRNYYPNHALRMPRIQDDRCKNTNVQKTLAMVRGWMMAVEMATPIIAQFPYGIIADKYGRRPVLFLSLFGCTLQTFWIGMVLLFPNTFNIWAVLPGSIFSLIGGGGSMAGAMVWTLIADVIPVSERTTVFNQVNAFILILNVVINPISALLLKYDPWLAMWLGFAFLVAGTFSALLIPETLGLRRKVDDDRRHGQQSTETGPVEEDEGYDGSHVKHGILQQAWFTVKNDMSHVYRFIFASKSIMILIVAFAVFFPIRLANSGILLQYMTKRFHWEWSKATFISTIGTLTTIVCLLVILPGASAFLTKIRGQSPLLKDLWLARASMVFMAAGCFLMAMASLPGFFVFSLVIQSLGFAFSPLCRALLNAVVEPHTVATLNTTISLIEMLVALIGGPAFGWLLGKGIELGGSWLGLPFLVMSGLAFCVSVAVFRFKLPETVAQAHEN